MTNEPRNSTSETARATGVAQRWTRSGLPGSIRRVKYRTTVLNPRGNATGIEVPAEVLDALGAGRRPLLRVTITAVGPGGSVGESTDGPVGGPLGGDVDGSDPVRLTWTTTAGSMGGAVMIPLSAEHRSAAGVAAHQEVNVEVELAAAPEALAVPADLAAAVQAVGASSFFEALAPSHRKEWVRWVQEAKKAQTRTSRVAQAAEALAARRSRR